LKKKIFIITGEASGDKLASNIVSYFKNSNIDLSAIGSNYLRKQKVKIIFDSSKLSVMGFIDVLKKFSFFLNRINFTINYIKEFKPDIIFSVDCPDFSFRVENKIKKILPNIQILHMVAPTIWAWRESRVFFFKKFIDHIFLLFPFEKKIFNKYKIKNTFVGHPFFEKKIKYKKFPMCSKNIITLCPGSRVSEIKIFMPIFNQLIELINKHYGKNFLFHFPVLKKHQSVVKSLLKSSNSTYVNIDENKKNFFINKSILCISKSGTMSLDVCKNNSPLITIYKTSWLNYFLIKPFVKVKYANIINIIANKEIIPELIQFNCTAAKIFKVASRYIESPNERKNNVSRYAKYIKKISNKNTSELVAKKLKVFFNLCLLILETFWVFHQYKAV